MTSRHSQCPLTQTPPAWAQHCGAVWQTIWTWHEQVLGSHFAGYLQTFGVQTHLLAEHVSPDGQLLPQFSVFPQPSEIVPQLSPAEAQDVVGVHAVPP